MTKTYRVPLDRRLHAPVDSNDEHDDRLRCACPEETAPPAERVRREEQEAEAARHLDDSVDARREEGDQVAVQAEGLENLGGVVVLCMLANLISLVKGTRKAVSLPESPKKERAIEAPGRPPRACKNTYDGIYTRELLGNHQSNRDDGTLAVGRDKPHLLEKGQG